MERVPTQTDLVRLCDAADEIVKFYWRRIPSDYGTVQDFTWELDLLHNIVRLLPYPRHYWTPFEIDFWEARTRWNGWTDEAYEAFAGIIFHHRNLYLMWNEAKDGAQPNDRIGESRGNVFVSSAVRRIEPAEFTFENEIDYLKQNADLLRSLCQFIPCEQQIDILSALEGKSRTAEQLMELCKISKSRLYGKRGNTEAGGLNELMRLDLVRNGSKDDSGIKGYYRPDRPPE
jgi:hypothetical protein